MYRAAFVCSFRIHTGKRAELAGGNRGVESFSLRNAGPTIVQCSPLKKLLPCHDSDANLLGISGEGENTVGTGLSKRPPSFNTRMGSIVRGFQGMG